MRVNAYEGYVYIDELLSKDGFSDITVGDDNGHHASVHIAKEDAIEIISHLTEVFELNNEQGEVCDIENMRYQSEEYECCMMAMDDDGVPRASREGVEFSLWGRALWMKDSSQ